MLNLRITLVFVLAAIILFTSGCATIQRAKKAEELEKELSQLTQLIREKDAQIDRLQELLNNQQRQFQEKELSCEREAERLHKELSKLRTSLKMLEKREPPLK